MRHWTYRDVIITYTPRRQQGGAAERELPVRIQGMNGVVSLSPRPSTSPARTHRRLLNVVANALPRRAAPAEALLMNGRASRAHAKQKDRFLPGATQPRTQGTPGLDEEVVEQPDGSVLT